MEIEKMETYIKPGFKNNKPIEIHFKGRSTLTGLFIRAGDYDELKSKNFWRVVHITRLEEWLETSDINVARIFSGASFTSLTNIIS